MKYSVRCILLLVSAAVLVSVTLASKQDATSITSKSLPAQPKARHSRSLGDMFEKMRSKIFGSRKQAAAVASSTGSASSSSSAVANQVQPASSVNIGQRQPWDLSSFNQQYNPYSPLSSSYQWPAGSSSGQFMNSQYNPMTYSMGSGQQSAYAGLNGAVPQSASSMLSTIDGQQSAAQASSLGGALGGSNGAMSASGQAGPGQANAASGLLSSASHLIAQYLSPNQGAGAVAGSSMGGAANVQANNQQQQQQQQVNMMSPQQQQQQQTQYNEFASILDSMVAQTGLGSQRQPSLNQYLNGPGVGGQPNGPQQANQMGVQQQQNSMYNQNGAAPNGGSPMMGDQDMSASSNIQSYMPASSAANGAQQQQQQQQVGAHQKSSMVGLAEQLAPGAQFNKLVSFPFSLSSNEDPSKEGRYKLHIPFLNQHVKRSDQQSAVVATPTVSSSSSSSSNSAQQQQRIQQQYLNSYMNQPQQQQQQQMIAQSSQVIPSIVSPQQSPVAASQPSVSSSVSSSISQSSSVSQSAQPSSSSSVVVSSQPAGQSSAVSSNSRPAWSVADSSKLIPMQPASSGSSVDSSITSSEN